MRTPAVASIGIKTTELGAYKLAGYDAPSPESLLLRDLARVNIFVGPNNSGKSRLLRELATFPQTALQFTCPTELADPIERAAKDLMRIAGSFSVKGFGTEGGLQYFPERHFQLRDDRVFDMSLLEELLLAYATLSQVTIDHIYHASGDRGQAPFGARALTELVPPVNRIGAFGQQAVEAIQKTLTFPTETARVYVPVFRGLRRIQTLPWLNIERRAQRDLFRAKTAQDYFKKFFHDLPAGGEPTGEHKPPDIFTGQDLYDRFRKLLLGDLASRERAGRYESFLSSTFFDDAPLSIVPKEIDREGRLPPLHDPEELEIKLGDEREWPVSQLGDGLQNLIVLTFLPETTEEPTLYFFEEPELYMHPGLQRELLEYMTRDQVHNYFLTTHSNHFLDMTLDYDDIAIFSLRKNPLPSGTKEAVASFTITQVDQGDRSTLADLGVRNSSVFLVNTTIWVEGITDRLYIRKMFDQWQEKQREADKSFTVFKEDLHFAFMEYGGGNIVHWSFRDAPEDTDDAERRIWVKRITDKAFVIADCDARKRDKRHAELQEALAEQYLRLEVREIENLLSPKVLWEVVKEYEEGKREKKKLPSLPPTPQFKVKEYQTGEVYLGAYINEVLEKEPINGWGRARKAGYAEEGGAERQADEEREEAVERRQAYGTIFDKRAFCKKALPHIHIDDVVGPAEELMKRIYEFLTMHAK